MKDRNYKSRRIILTVLIITVISAIGLYINNTLTSSNLKKNGIIMSAEIIEITVNNEKIEGSGLGLQPNYNKYIKVKYKYRVDTKDYISIQEIKTRDLLNGLQLSLNKGDSILIKYLPSRPKTSDLYINDK
ncbi:MAG: hypothetical protein R2759_17395 [Bacteroidales bacterium]